MTNSISPIADAVSRSDRGAARRQAFLDAARSVFLEQGYEAASVNDIVRRAGGSLATLYAQYGNKEGLFLAVMEDGRARFMERLSATGADHLPVEEGLQRIGEQFLHTWLEPDTVAFFRINIGERRKLPTALRQTLTAAGEKVEAVVAEFLRVRKVDAAPLASAHLVDLWRGRHHYRSLSDDAYALSDGEITRHVAACIQLFLYGVRGRPA